MHLNVFVSSKCFLYCKGCYSFSREEQCDKQVSTNRLVEFLQFAYNRGVHKVTLCGGAPLTRKDIIDLLEKIKQIGFLISLDTLGSPIIGDVKNKNSITRKIDAQKLCKLVDMIGIPIDGSDNKIFKRFRQTEVDLIEQQLLVCEELYKCGGNICVNTVVHKGNLEDVKDLTKLIKKLNYIKKWQIFQFTPSGKFGKLNRHLFEISDEEFSRFKSNVLDLFDGDSSQIDFKDSHMRNKLYMLIDNSGNAWIPYFENESLTHQNERKIVGNINNSSDWSEICSYLEMEA